MKRRQLMVDSELPVDTESKFAPPPGLSKKSRALWAAVVPRRARSPERLALLRVGLDALDRANEAREAIAKEGLTSTTTTTGARHIHPLLKVERDARNQFIAVWKNLNLEWNQNIDGRTPDRQGQ